MRETRRSTAHRAAAGGGVEGHRTRSATSSPRSCTSRRSAARTRSCESRVAELEERGRRRRPRTERDSNEVEALLELQESFSARVETTAAQVIANGVSNFEWTITIDKGSDDGIAGRHAGRRGRRSRRSHRPRDAELVVRPADHRPRVLGRRQARRVGRDRARSRARATAISGWRSSSPTSRSLPDETRRDGRLSASTAGRREPLSAERPDRNGVAGAHGRHARSTKFVTVRPAVDFSTLNVVLVVLRVGRDSLTPCAARSCSPSSWSRRSCCRPRSSRTSGCSARSPS